MDETRRRSGKVVALVLVPAAALVAVVMLVLRMRIEPPTVPHYRIVPAASASAEPILRPGDRLTLTLEPEGQLTGAIAGRGFLVQGQQVRNVEPLFVVDRDGTIHVEGDVSKLFDGVPAGRWELAIAVGRPETLPRTPADVLRASQDAGTKDDAAWYLLTQPVRFGG